MDTVALTPFRTSPDRFPHLSRAPIAEATIEIRARAVAKWEEAIVRDALSRRLSDYPQVFQRRQVQQQLVVRGSKAEHQVSDAGWTGLEFRSAHGKQVARFERDAFSFARLRPYQRWEKFESEVLRLWKIHCTIAQPTDIQRVGVRFINRIQVPPGQLNIDDYLVGGPHQPRGLDLHSVGFFHHDVVAIPGSEYNGNIIRTIQRPPNAQSGPVLILDIDIFTVQPAPVDEGVLKRRLVDMRWLKNKIFFGSITSKTKELSE
ncbi:MAG: TIGR04255 family protein [Chthoniobacterales bacterium]